MDVTEEVTQEETGSRRIIATMGINTFISLLFDQYENRKGVHSWSDFSMQGF
jgi:hypothetical protein